MTNGTWQLVPCPPENNIQEGRKEFGKGYQLSAAGSSRKTAALTAQINCAACVQ